MKNLKSIFLLCLIMVSMTSCKYLEKITEDDDEKDDDKTEYRYEKERGMNDRDYYHDHDHHYDDNYPDDNNGQLGMTVLYHSQTDRYLRASLKSVPGGRGWYAIQDQSGSEILIKGEKTLDEINLENLAEGDVIEQESSFNLIPALDYTMTTSIENKNNRLLYQGAISISVNQMGIKLNIIYSGMEGIINKKEEAENMAQYVVSLNKGSVKVISESEEEWASGEIDEDGEVTNIVIDPSTPIVVKGLLMDLVQDKMELIL